MGKKEEVKLRSNKLLGAYRSEPHMAQEG